MNTYRNELAALGLKAKFEKFSKQYPRHAQALGLHLAGKKQVQIAEEMGCTIVSAVSMFRSLGRSLYEHVSG